MAKYLDTIKREFNPNIKPLKDDIELRKNKNFFWPTGTQIYIGRQGEGKTLSAVKHAIKLKERYPKCIIVSNLELNFLTPVKLGLSTEQDEYLATFPDREFEARKRRLLIKNLREILSSDPYPFVAQKQYIRFSDMSELAVLLTEVNNLFYGVVYIIDEIHTYMNALDSKNIPMYIFTEISQQRKQRKLIIGTSQLFMRVAKPMREQCDNVIKCKTYFGIFTTQKAYDGETVEQDYDGSLKGLLKKRGFFFHTRELRNAFDTYQKVVSGSEQYENTVNNIVLDKKQLKALRKR